MRARVCVGFKALVVSRLKEIRARETREKGVRGNANSDRLGKSDRIIVSFLAAKNTFCSRALQYISFTKRGSADDDFVHYSFVRPLFSVALAYF